jgi:hypothetical protein
MRPVEALYLLVGLGIVLHGVYDHGLTVVELGAGMFFIGLVPVSRADRKAMDSPMGFARKALLAWLESGNTKK